MQPVPSLSQSLLLTAVLVFASILPAATAAPGQAIAQAASQPAVASGTKLLEEAIGLDGYAIFVSSGAPGMVLAVVRGPDSIVQGYGETALGNGKEPDGKSLVRIGSITKAVTGEMLAGMTAAGKVHLTDPLRLYTNGSPVPKFGDREITLLDLATHSAGFPRQTGLPQENPPKSYITPAQRLDWLAKFQPAWSPGLVAAYSNIGFDLLADALSRAAGKPYPELLAEQLTTPLGMKDTGFQPTKEQCARLMLGSGLGGSTPCNDTQNNPGAGGLYSTGDDMVIWLRHHMQPDTTQWPGLALDHAIYRQRQALDAAIGFDEAGPMSGISLAWILSPAHDRYPAIMQKSGGSGGFMSYIAFAPGRNVGVFLVVNRIDFAMYHGLTEAANGIIANLAPR